MKKKKITYGVHGMMEYIAMIKLGTKNRIKVTFTDGSITAMGVNPATFVTDNLMVQHAIEHSPEYARGLIKTVRVVELDTEVVIERNVPCCDKHTEAEVAKQEETPAEKPTEQESTESTSENSTEKQPEVEEAKNEPAQEVTEVEFSNNGDAKVYLEEKFGVAPSKLRTREIIESTAKSYGVVIKWVG